MGRYTWGVWGYTTYALVSLEDFVKDVSMIRQQAMLLDRDRSHIDWNYLEGLEFRIASGVE